MAFKKVIRLIALFVCYKCVVGNESVSITRPKPLNLKPIGTNSEEAIEENAFKDLHDFNFPDVTYPTSILESCQPFYFNSNTNGLDAIVGPFSSEVKSNYMSLLSNNENKKASTKIPELKDKSDYMCQLITEDVIDDKEELNADTIEVIPEVDVISSELKEILSILYNDEGDNTSLDVDNYEDIYSLQENIPELDIYDDSNKNNDENEPDEMEENYLDAIVGPFSSEVKSNYMSLLSNNENKKAFTKIAELKDKSDYVCQLITEAVIDDKEELNADTIEVIPEVDVISSELKEILSILYNDEGNNTSLDVDNYEDIYPLQENIPELDIYDDSNKNNDENEPDEMEENDLDAIVGPFSSEVKSNYMSLLSNNENKKASTKIPELKDKSDYVCQLITEAVIDDKEELNADTIEVIPEVDVISSELKEILSILYNDEGNNTSLDVDNYEDIYPLQENIPELDIYDDSNKNNDENEPDEMEENDLDAIVGPFSSEVKSNYMSLLSNNENKKASTKIPELKDKSDYVCQLITEDVIDDKEELNADTIIEDTIYDKEEFNADTIEVIPEVDVISSELKEILSILYNDEGNNTSLDVDNYEDIYPLQENIPELDIYDDSNINNDENEPDEREENAADKINERELDSIEEYVDYIMKSDNTYTVKEIPKHINEVEEKITESYHEDIDNYLLNAHNIDVTLSELIKEYIYLYENLNDSNLGEDILESVIYEIDHYLKSDDSDTIEPVYEIINDDIDYNLSDSNLDVIERESINENVDNDYNSNSSIIEIDETRPINESIDEYNKLNSHNSVGDSSVDVVLQESINEEVDDAVNLNSLNLEIEEIENKNESVNDFNRDNLMSVDNYNVDIIVQGSIKNDVDYDLNLSSPNIEIEELQTENESIDDLHKCDNENSVEITAQEYIEEDLDIDFNLNNSYIEIKNIKENTFDSHNSVDKPIYIDLNQSDLNTDEKMLEVIKVDDGIITIPKEAVVFDVIYKDGCYSEKPLLDIVPSNIPVRLKINIEICKDEFRVGNESYMKEINKEPQTLKTIENTLDFNDCKENFESFEEESVTEEQITVLDEINESDFISALSILLLDSLNNKPLEILTPEIVNTECDINTSISDTLECPSNDNIYSEDLGDKLESNENEQVEMREFLFSNENYNERFTSPLISILSPKTKIVIDQEIANNNISDILEQLVISNNKWESTEYEDESTTELIEMCPLLSLLYNKTEESSELMERVLCKSQEDVAEIIDLETSIEASEENKSVKDVDPVESWPLIDVFQLRIMESSQTPDTISDEEDINTE